MPSVEQVSIHTEQDEQSKFRDAEFATKPEHVSGYDEERETPDDTLDELAEQENRQAKQIEVCRQEAEEKMNCKMAEDKPQGRGWEVTLKADGSRELTDLNEGRVLKLNAADAKYLEENIINKLRNGEIDVFMDAENKTVSISYGLTVTRNAFGEIVISYSTLSFIDAGKLAQPEAAEYASLSDSTSQTPEPITHITLEAPPAPLRSPAPPALDRTMQIFTARQQEIKAMAPKGVIKTQEIKQPQHHGASEKVSVPKVVETTITTQKDTESLSSQQTEDHSERVAVTERPASSELITSDSISTLEVQPSNGQNATPEIQEGPSEKPESRIVMTYEFATITSIKEQLPLIGKVDIPPIMPNLPIGEPKVPWGDQELTTLIDTAMVEHLERGLEQLTITPETSQFLLTEPTDPNFSIENAIIIEPTPAGTFEVSLYLQPEPIIPVEIFQTTEVAHILITPTLEHAYAAPQPTPEDSGISRSTEPGGTVHSTIETQPPREMSENSVLEDEGEVVSERVQLPEVYIETEMQEKTTSQSLETSEKISSDQEKIVLSQKPSRESTSRNRVSTQETLAVSSTDQEAQAVVRQPLIIPLVPFTSARQSVSASDDINDPARTRQSGNSRILTQAA